MDLLNTTVSMHTMMGHAAGNMTMIHNVTMGLHHINAIHNHMNMSHNDTSTGHHGMNMDMNANHGHAHDMNMDGSAHGMSHGMMNGNTTKHSSHMGGHAMFFSFILPIQVLFYEWNIENDAQLAASCVGVFLIAILYEGLKVWRQYLIQMARRSQSQQSSKRSSISGSEVFYKTNQSKWSRFCNGWHFLQSFLQIIQTTVGMFLMLIYMTFNIWMAIVVSVGSGVGYLLFAWLISSNLDFGEHCH